MKSHPTADHLKPWYRHGMVWMLIAGPALVVVAAVFTAFIAMRSPDPVLANDAYEYGQKSDEQAQRSLLPAQRARNHAATPDHAPIQ
ncbi:MAG: hypothetical protein RIT26_1979 [Pseudomonadota bacterium]|jgi:hypothetical protein